jgi:protein-S-isoprenylcysteine O-methyltransferase Ste14
VRWLVLLWVAFFCSFAGGHLRVRHRRGRRPAKEKRVERDRSSDAGLALQLGAMMLGWLWRGPLRTDLLPAAIAIGVGSVALAWYAVFHLGRQWRIQAVVTEDHELITSGPYAWVRHPIYLAFLGMVASWSMATCPWPVCAAACGLFVVGTEIRVAAEDRLLERAFPKEAPSWKRNVAAYLPWVR